MKIVFHYIFLLFKIPGFVAARIFNYVSLHAFDVHYKKYPIISGKLLLKGKGKIVFGEAVRINSSLDSNPVGMVSNTVLFAYDKALIQVGNRVGISNSLICAMDRIVIEDNVLLGGGAQVFDNDFHSIKLRERMAPIDSNIKIMPVTIKKGAFIGCNAIITKGVVIGERSVIAAGSVVISNIPDDQVWGGNPARFIKVIDNNS